MSEQTTVSADVNSESQASGDIDAKLNEMQASEVKSEQQVEQKPEVQTQEEGEKTPKVVPLAALHEERRARQELQRQLQENARRQAERDAVIERRLAALMPKQQAPDPATDGVGYIDHRINELAQKIEPVLQAQSHAAQEQQKAVAISQLTNHVLAARVEFEKDHPDLSDAGKHLNEVRARELMVYGMPEAQARMQATQELDQALLQWAAQGMNPVQVAYEFALARGYTPKQAQQQADAQQKIAAQQKGTQAAKSLGNGGAVTQGKLTAEALANMSDDDFAKLTDAQFRQAMGG